VFRSKRGKDSDVAAASADRTTPASSVATSVEEEEQWWLPLGERLAAKNRSASGQIPAERSASAKSPDSPQPTTAAEQGTSAELSQRPSMSLAVVAVLAAAAGAGLTSWWLIGQRPALSQSEPQRAAAPEVVAPQTESASRNDVPLPHAAPNARISSPTPAAQAAQPPAGTRRPRSEPKAVAQTASTQVASAPSPSPAPELPPAPVEPATATASAPAAAPEAPESPRTPFFASTDVNEPPQVATRVEPRLPDDLSSHAVNDVVVVRLLVSQTGHPFRISFLRRSKAGAQLDDAVIAAVNRWTFSPARKKGEAVSCWLNVGVPIRSGSAEASTSVATLGDSHSSDQAYHAPRSRQ